MTGADGGKNGQIDAKESGRVCPWILRLLSSALESSRWKEAPEVNDSRVTGISGRVTAHPLGLFQLYFQT